MTTPTLPRTLPFPWYVSTSVTSDVPGKYPCALNGRPLMIDDGANSGWVHQGIQQIRTQADSSTTPSEASLNPQGLWRRAQESWHRGAGQLYRDKTNADEFRFESSKGVDPWTPYQLTLLPDTDQKATSSNTNMRLETAGSRIYYSDGVALKFTADITADTPSFTPVTGTSGQSITALASDGYNVYIGSGSSGIYKTDAGISTAAAYVTSTVTGPVAYVKGRLMCAEGPSIYNITGAGALPTALLTQANTAFSWVGFAEGTAAIYAAGVAGDKSLIYRIAVKADGSALDAPVIAGELPDGELVTGIGGYLGFVFLGSSKGVRFCQVDGQGNLTIGPLIETDRDVVCFEGQENFVWFGWESYDATSSGLGRMDLTQFTEDILTGGRKPAYASDLMYSGQAVILSVVTFQGIRVFTASGSGLWAEDTDLVSTGTITSGQIGFGLPDDKVAVELVLQTNPLAAGSYSASMSVDSGTATVLGSTTSSNSTTSTYPLNYLTGQYYELTITLNGSGTAGPELVRWTMKASPGSSDGPAEYLMVPFLLHSTLQLPGGAVPCDVKLERDAIKSLRESRQVVSYQDVDQSYQVIVENYEWHPAQLGYSTLGGYKTENGTMLTQLKRIA